MGYRELTEKVMSGEYLDKSEIIEIVSLIKNSSLSDLEFVAILTAMQTRDQLKGISVEEYKNFVEAFRTNECPDIDNALCNSGTGGDKFETINISTIASIIIASGGINVLKNGSKGTRGGRGSKEAFEALGINTLEDIDQVFGEARKVGIGYYDFSKIVPIKGRAGVKSPLNLLGPLCNPVHLKYKVMGCSNKDFSEKIEPILEQVCENYMITYNPSIDEISLCEPTIISERRNQVRSKYTFNPIEHGFTEVKYSEILSPKDDGENVELMLSVLGGKEGPAREIVCLNAGAGLYLASKANSVREGYKLAMALIDSRKAMRKLIEWREQQKDGATH
ncbi:MAG: hypothetical protein KGH55_01270 [Nanoarchaeota archaeon]|nr:hypothetical protein [Nanoarchaeota archaeon]